METDFSLFLAAQLNAINTSKYLESQKANKDLFFDKSGFPSQDFYLWWAGEHAEKFRAAWPKSLCKTCQRVLNCKDCLRNECVNYQAQKGL